MNFMHSLHIQNPLPRNLVSPLALFLALLSTFSAATPQQQPLVQKADLTYLGAFALPQGDYGTSRFGYGGQGVAYYLDPGTGKHTLFMEGHAWFPGHVGQVQVPADDQLVKSRDWSELNQATVLQNFSDVTDGHLAEIGYLPFVYGMLVYNNRLIIGASSYYDGGGEQVNSHGVSGLNLAGAGDFQGFFPMTGVATPRSKGGHMTTVPAEWRTLFGGPALTGKGCLSIISNNSCGPCATVFDPDDVGNENPIPGNTLLFYPLDHPLAAPSSQNELFNLTTHMLGIAFPTASRSVLFFGRHGYGPYCYGIGGAAGECPDPCDDSHGTHAYPYRAQVWAYDANDLMSVKNGIRQSWEIQPYAYWTMDEITDVCSNPAGACYDPDTGRLYITDAQGEQALVYVYQITVPGIKLQSRIFLQGTFDTAKNRMKKTLNALGHVPLDAPYDGCGAHANTIPAAAVDWLKISLYSDASNPVAVECTSCFVDTNGYLIDTQGRAGVSLTSPAGAYYLVVEHRNHCSISSATAIQMNDATALYDFTTGLDKYYGSRAATQVAAGVFALWGGDVNQNKYVTSEDYVLWYNAVRSSLSGYQAADLNMDGMVNAQDFSLWGNNAQASAGAQTP